MSRVLGILFLIGWVSGQMLRLPGGMPVTLMDVAMGFLLINFVLCRKTIVNRHRTFLWVGFVGVGSWLLGLRIFSVSESLVGLLYLVRILGYLLIILHARELFKSVKKWIYLTLITFVVLGLGQYIFLPDTRFLLQYGWDEHYYRLIGTMLDPNYMGAMLGMISILSADQFLKTKRPKWRILGVLGILGLSLTFSRAAWLATLVGLLVYFVISVKTGIYKNNLNRFRIKSGMALKILMGVLGIVGIYLIALKPGGEGVNIFRTFSIEQRIESWQEGIAVWGGHPWLGVGFNNYAEEVQEGNHSENAPSNSWILMLATMGVAGTAALGIMGMRGVRGMSSMRMGIAILLSVHAVFNNTLFYTPILGLAALIKAASEE